MPTFAPTPQPTFAVASIAVVVPTTLIGFSKNTFTAGVQQAYRLTIAAEANVTVAEVIISNIRDEPHTRAGREDNSGRKLAATAVAFDMSISVADTAAATAMTNTINNTTPAALKVQLVTQLRLVQAMGDFADVASVNIDAIASAITVHPQTDTILMQVVTGAPTPAPPSMNSELDENARARKWRSGLFIAVGAIVGVIVIYVAVRVMHRSSKEKTHVDEHTSNESAHIPIASPMATKNSIDDRFGTDHVLPPGWRSARDPASGNTYYFNEDSNETSWSFPVGGAGLPRCGTDAALIKSRRVI